MPGGSSVLSPVSHIFDRVLAGLQRGPGGGVYTYKPTPYGVRSSCTGSMCEAKRAGKTADGSPWRPHGNACADRWAASPFPKALDSSPSLSFLKRIVDFRPSRTLTYSRGRRHPSCRARRINRCHHPRVQPRLAISLSAQRAANRNIRPSPSLRPSYLAGYQTNPPVH